ncbi:YciI family protein [Mycobacterium sp.]|uniref:YciI family protein n=1 Tax=Mycobacterium sp. TaxID=1785 RepID=UPI002CB13D0C|nr:YciI family protein [Mycobacterium sp.]HME50498.1 YciI family protein [Mycobacterium sp.]
MTDKLFLFRLIPPRSDFAQTLTLAEQDAMVRHAEYWKNLLAAGRVVVFGPVADPEGVWGLGVVRAGTQEDVVALGEKDPAIAAGVATFDVAEIMGGLTG